MRCLEIKRQMASDDIASVTELLDAAARADGRRPLSDHLYLDLVNGGLDGFAGFLASEPGHDHPVAYAQISRGNDAHAFNRRVSIAGHGDFDDLEDLVSLLTRRRVQISREIRLHQERLADERIVGIVPVQLAFQDGIDDQNLMRTAFDVYNIGNTRRRHFRFAAASGAFLHFAVADRAFESHAERNAVFLLKNSARNLLDDLKAICRENFGQRARLKRCGRRNARNDFARGVIDGFHFRLLRLVRLYCRNPH
jgi:hypothetical protein